jgi:hypothetical protein
MWATANLTAKSSKQNNVVVKTVDFEPNAFRPMSAYDLKLSSSKIIRARILALFHEGVSGRTKLNSTCFN